MAPVSDGLQNLGSSVSVVVFPAGGGSPSQPIDVPITLPASNLVTIKLASAPGASITFTHVLVQGRILELFPTSDPTTFTSTPDQLAYAALPAGSAISNVRPARITRAVNPSDTIDIKDASQLYTNALLEFDNGSGKEYRTVVAINDVSVTVSGTLSTSYFEAKRSASWRPP